MKWAEELNNVTTQQELMEAHQERYAEGVRLMSMELSEAEIREEEGCKHINNETIELPFCDETYTICHDCGYEI